jgi:hypothetical protein
VQIIQANQYGISIYESNSTLLYAGLVARIYLNVILRTKIGFSVQRNIIIFPNKVVRDYIICSAPIALNCLLWSILWSGLPTSESMDIAGHQLGQSDVDCD